MKKFRSLFLAILLLAAVTAPAWADNDHGGPSWQRAGWENGKPGNGLALGHSIRRGNMAVQTLASGRAPGGQADPQVTVTPAGGSTQSAIVCATVDPPWASPLRDSRWISLQSDCTTALANSTNFVYSTTFTLPSNHSVARIDGQVLADDSVTIQLNGTTIFTGGDLVTPATFSSSDASLFTSGTNTLTFTVFNTSGASGLDYIARVQDGRAPRMGDNNGDDDSDD